MRDIRIVTPILMSAEMVVWPMISVNHSHGHRLAVIRVIWNKAFVLCMIPM